jgi:hypothetical protein
MLLRDLLRHRDQTLRNRKASLPTAVRLVPRSATRTAGPPPKQLDECIGLWLLKNSLSKNPQKLDRVRMPYKRFVGVA